MKSRVRPRERVELEGVQSLEDVELIALLLGTGHQGKEVESLAQEVLVLDHIVVAGDTYVSFADEG